MKELIKPKKKKLCFEALKVEAYHEKNGEYSEGGYYLDGMVQSYYRERNAVDLEDNLLF